MYNSPIISFLSIDNQDTLWGLWSSWVHMFTVYQRSWGCLSWQFYFLSIDNLDTLWGLWSSWVHMFTVYLHGTCKNSSKPTKKRHKALTLPRARLLFRARTESDAAASQQEQTRGSNYSSAQPVGGLADFSFASLGHPPAFPDNIPDVDTPPSADCGPPFVIGRETLPRTESLDIWSSIHNFWYFRERGFLLESEELRRLIFSKQKHPVPEDLWIPGEGVDQCVSAVVSLLANPYVLSKHMKKNCKQSGGLGIATATVVTVIGDNTTVNAQVLAPTLHPEAVQQQ